MATWRKTRHPRPTTRRSRNYNKNTRVWTCQEIAFLRKYYRTYDTQWCARQLGRTVYSVRYKASNLSIRKTNPSNWKNPTENKITFRPGYAHQRQMTRTPKRNIRWTARMRRNNRRPKW
jgi:hypothetical protein